MVPLSKHLCIALNIYPVCNLVIYTDNILNHSFLSADNKLWLNMAFIFIYKSCSRQIIAGYILPPTPNGSFAIDPDLLVCIMNRRIPRNTMLHYVQMFNIVRTSVLS